METSKSWGNEYVTSADTRRALGDRFFPSAGVYFYAGFVGIIARERYRIARGRYELGGSNQTAVLQSTHPIFRLIERCNGRFHITGLEHVPACSEPMVIISNHMSALETTILPFLVAPFRPVTFVVKTSLLEYPVFGSVLATHQPIAVERANPREDFQMVMQEGAARLAQGMAVIVYPQSTRSLTFDPQTFNTLGIKLARKANVPVLPVAVKTNFWGNGRYLRDFGPIDRTQPIHIAFGPPMPVQGNGKATHQQVVEFITAQLQQW